MSAEEVEPRCPRCGGLFTPDQVKHAVPAAECTFCKMTVLLRRPKPVREAEREAAPLAWPKGFEVVETPAPGPERALVRVGGDPYREPGAQALALRPGLTITWKDENFDALVLLGLFDLFMVIGSALAWIMSVNKLGAAAVTALTVVLVWITRIAWRNDNWVLADHEGLHWTRTKLTTRVVKEFLPAAEIAQLYVRDKTTPDPDGGSPWRWFVLYARDHGGRDHVIASVEDPEQAWWLEARLEQHLGIVNRRIEGEHRREPPLLPAPADS